MPVRKEFDIFPVLLKNRKEDAGAFDATTHDNEESKKDINTLKSEFKTEKMINHQLKRQSCKGQERKEALKDLPARV